MGWCLDHRRVLYCVLIFHITIQERTAYTASPPVFDRQGKKLVLGPKPQGLGALGPYPAPRDSREGSPAGTCTFRNETIINHPVSFGAGKTRSPSGCWSSRSSRCYAECALSTSDNISNHTAVPILSRPLDSSLEPHHSPYYQNQADSQIHRALSTNHSAHSKHALSARHHYHKAKHAFSFRHQQTKTSMQELRLLSM